MLKLTKQRLVVTDFAVIDGVIAGAVVRLYRHVFSYLLSVQLSISGSSVNTVAHVCAGKENVVRFYF